jgi:hypothetical protein
LCGLLNILKTVASLVIVSPSAQTAPALIEMSVGYCGLIRFVFA